MAHSSLAQYWSQTSHSFPPLIVPPMTTARAPPLLQCEGPVGISTVCLSHLNLEMASYNLTFPNSSSIPLGDWPDLRITELILSGLHLSLPTSTIPNLKFKAPLYWVPTPPPSSGLSHHLHSACSAYSWDWTFLGFPCSHWFLFPDLMGSNGLCLTPALIKPFLILYFSAPVPWPGATWPHQYPPLPSPTLHSPQPRARPSSSCSSLCPHDFPRPFLGGNTSAKGRIIFTLIIFKISITV